MGKLRPNCANCDEAGDCGLGSQANRRFVWGRTSNEAQRIFAFRRIKRSGVCEDVPVTFVEYVRAEIIGSNRAVENVSASRVYRLDGM